MKNILYILSIALFGFGLVSCNDDENEAVPSYLDGTQYGVLLHVDVASGKTISIANVNTATVNFTVSFEGEKRPVASIKATKTFTPTGGAASAAIDQMTFTTFPSTVSVSVSDLVQGVPGLTSTADLNASDSFLIKFIITYQDGGVATRYGTLNNPNFSVKFN
ncbi:MAG: hypothetical protein WAU36_00995 [Cyclobacteriaceae bacterium]